MSELLSQLRATRWGKSVEAHPGRAVTVVLCLVLLFQVIRIGHGAFAVRRIDSAVDGLVSSKEDQAAGKWSPPPVPELADPWQEKPNYAFQGVVGNMAIINGQPVKAGDRVGSATVETVGINSVTIRKEDGQTQELKLFDALQVEQLPPTPTPTPVDARQWREPSEIVRRFPGDLHK
jgi:hypothetical protein